MKNKNQSVCRLSVFFSLATIFSFITGGCMMINCAEGTNGRYMVIDLSGGTNAVSYPVTYLESVPSGSWTDEYKTTKLVMRRIPTGLFTMGSPDAEFGPSGSGTQHTVMFTKDSYIGVFEVTQRQWELVMGNRPSSFTNETYYASRPLENVSYYDIRENPDNSDDTAVEWPQNSVVTAASFMGRLRAKTGLLTLDLPTESLWEYSCRARTVTALDKVWDNNLMDCDAQMDVTGRCRSSFIDKRKVRFTQNSDTSVATAKVGSYLPNGWGLYDMHGNVSEWCLDWYGTYPDTVTDPLGAPTGSYRVVRGGSWSVSSWYCCSAVRGRVLPGSRGSNFGFRVAMTLP